MNDGACADFAHACNGKKQRQTGGCEQRCPNFVMGRLSTITRFSCPIRYADSITVPNPTESNWKWDASARTGIPVAKSVGNPTGFRIYSTSVLIAMFGIPFASRNANVALQRICCTVSCWLDVVGQEKREWFVWH